MMKWILESDQVTEGLQKEIDWRVTWLKAQRWMYYNGHESCPDLEFDSMEAETRSILIRFIPDHPYLNKVGSDLEPDKDVKDMMERILNERRLRHGDHGTSHAEAKTSK